MSNKLNCPCCDARHGEPHDHDCALVAYLESRSAAHVLEPQQARVNAQVDVARAAATAPALLDAAAGHMRDRAATYDQPSGERSMGRTVAAFNIITGRELTESEGWLLMQILKDVRDRQREKPHRDSLEDGIAYAALKAEARLAE